MYSVSIDPISPLLAPRGGCGISNRSAALADRFEHPSTQLAVRADLRVQLIGIDGIDRSVDDICTALFGNGRSIALGHVSSLDIATASHGRYLLLRDSGLRHTSWLGKLLFGAGYVALIGFGWVQLALGLSGLVWPFLGAGTLAVLLLVAAAHYYPTLGRLTARGRALRDRLAGLHRFVTMAEADRIAWMQNAVDAPRVTGADDGSLIDLYEPLLPYAIIFGVEDTWRQALGNLYDLVPARPEHPVDVPAVALAMAWSDYAPQYHRRTPEPDSFWDGRPAWGEGWVAGAGRGLGEALDSWATSRSSRLNSMGAAPGAAARAGQRHRRCPHRLHQSH